MTLATIKYDFDSAEYVVYLDDDPERTYSHADLFCALELLRHDSNKHELWADGKVRQ